MAANTPPISPQGPYRRSLRGGDFSLEKSTEDVPDDGLYYLIKKGKVKYTSEDFRETLTEYYKLCEVWWKKQIKSSDPDEQKRGALGLLNLDVNNEIAADVLKECGTAADMKRLEQARNRARHAAMKAATLAAKEKAAAAAKEREAAAEEEEAAAKELEAAAQEKEAAAKELEAAAQEKEAAVKGKEAVAAAK